MDTFAHVDETASNDLFTGPFRLSIAGRLVTAAAHFDVINPATGKVFARHRPPPSSN